MFDTVEYPVLLDHLDKAGIKAKLWHLMKDWYTNISSQVLFCGTTSSPFSISHGVRQGSVLSPDLFMLFMDPGLLKLKSKSVVSLYVDSLLGPSLMQIIFVLSNKCC